MESFFLLSSKGNITNSGKPGRNMGINQKDIKLLWGRSGSRCALCKKELTQDKKGVSSSFTLGEQAHIVGEKFTAARGNSPLSDDERNSYHNLILLCPNHHTIIDSNPEDWPVEKLYQAKSTHELWVTDKLSLTYNAVQQAEQLAISLVVDKAVTMCMLENWMNWTSYALSHDPKWPKFLPDQIFDFQKIVISTVWPDKHHELKRSIQSLSLLLNVAAQTFLKHSDLRGDTYFPDKFYKNFPYSVRDEKAREYDAWLDECHSLLVEATKCANWFADMVRKDINPLFFIEEGKFLTIEGDILGYEHKLYEYTAEQKQLLPDSLPFLR